MTNICLTFDYELFFGDISGTVEHTIIKPVDKLLEVLNETNVNAIFFVDALFLFRLRTEGLQATQNAYEMIAEQLRLAYTLGYEVEIHIHSHWMDAIYDHKVNMWRFPSMKRYKLHDLPDNPDSSCISKTQCIALAKEELQRIIYEVDKTYKPRKFRAGGWCVEPFLEISQSLAANEIYQDYSTIHDFTLATSVHDVDFTRLPQRANWNFHDDIRINQKSGRFSTQTTASWHVSILIYRLLKFFDIILYSKLQTKHSNERFSDGRTIDVKGTKYISVKKTCIALDTDKLTSRMMCRVEKKFRQRFRLNNQDIIYTIGHPKSMSPASLHELRRYLNDR